jgi:hypothetical protein
MATLKSKKTNVRKKPISEVLSTQQSHEDVPEVSSTEDQVSENKINDYIWKRDWLNEDPPASYVAVNRGTGREYIPIGFVEEMLDELTGGNWNIEDFFFEITRHNTAWIANGRGTLVVFYDGICRRVSGAKSFKVGGADENDDYAGSALSFVILSASTKLGKKFGRGLNERLVLPENRTAVPVIQPTADEVPAYNDIKMKRKPDMLIMKKLEQAVREDDTKTIKELYDNYDIQAPDPQPTEEFSDIKKDF